MLPALVCIGVIGLGIVESREDDELRRERQAASNYKYAKSWLALFLPVAYCLLDAAGTFADTMVLDKLAGEAEAAGMFATAEECSSYAASAANSAYELTFLFATFCCIIYVGFIKKQKFTAAQEGPKYLGALCETAAFDLLTDLQLLRRSRCGALLLNGYPGRCDRGEHASCGDRSGGSRVHRRDRAWYC